MKFQFSWPSALVVVAVIGAVAAFMLTGHSDKLEAAGMGVLALLALVARSPLVSDTKAAPAAETFPDEEPTKKEGKSVPPMQAIVFLIGFVLAARALVGCAAAAESTYTGQQLQCVDRAKTLEESKACRAEVDRAWRVVDGGVQ